MHLYKIGKVISIGKIYIIFETNYTGNIIYVPNPKRFEKHKSKIIKIYIYIYSSEYTQATYGFETFGQRILFEDLISVNGIGPKTALNILKEGYQNIVQLIQEGDAKALASFPYLGIKSANQLIFELKSKYGNVVLSNTNKKNVPSTEIINPLKTLGFSKKQIDFAITKLTKRESIEKMIEEAIRIISNVKFS